MSKNNTEKDNTKTAGNKSPGPEKLSIPCADRNVWLESRL